MGLNNDDVRRICRFRKGLSAYLEPYRMPRQYTISADADCVVATVADGHGSKQYFRPTEVPALPQSQLAIRFGNSKINHLSVSRLQNEKK